MLHFEIGYNFLSLRKGRFIIYFCCSKKVRPKLRGRRCRRMKKLFIGLISFVLCVAISACGSAPTPSEISKALWDSNAFGNREDYHSLDSTQLKNYFALDDELVKDFSVYISSFDDSASEFGIFTLRDPDNLTAVVDSINSYCATAAASFGTHNGGSPKEKFLLMKINDSVIYLITEKYADAEAALKELGATEIN